MAEKTVCPVSRGRFTAHAKPIGLLVNGNAMAANPKLFSTGSFGYYQNGKVYVDIDGVRVLCQVGITITAVGSKELPYDPPAVAS